MVTFLAVLCLLLFLMYGPSLISSLKEETVFAWLRRWREACLLWFTLLLLLRGYFIPAGLVLLVGSIFFYVPIFQPLQHFLLDQVKAGFHYFQTRINPPPPAPSHAAPLTPLRLLSLTERLARQGSFFWFLIPKRTKGELGAVEQQLDRWFPGWRSARESYEKSWRHMVQVRGRNDSLSQEEAHELLGLEDGATAKEITRTHHQLIKKLHPDYGGAADLAALANQARDRLLR